MLFEGEVMGGPEKGIVLRCKEPWAATLKWPGQPSKDWPYTCRRIDYEYRDGGWHVASINGAMA